MTDAALTDAMPNQVVILLAGLLIAASRLPFWRLPPHVDLALWGSWATYSRGFFPPARLLEFNQGGSRLALFLQYRVGTWLTGDLHLIQNTIDALCILVAAYATFLYTGTSPHAMLLVFLTFAIINNPRTQTYFANSETQILAGLAIVLWLLTRGSGPTCLLAGAILTFHCTFHKITFAPDWLVGLVFARYRIPYIAGSAVVAVIWFLLQRRLVTGGRATSFIGHWRFALAEKGRRILYDPFFKQGRETSAGLIVLSVLVVFFADRARPETWLFAGHIVAYVAQIRAHPYHAIPAIFTGMIAVGPALPQHLLIVALVLALAGLVFFAIFPRQSFWRHPWEFFLRWNYDLLEVAKHLREKHAQRLEGQSLLVWSWHTNLYWMLNVRPPADWLQVCSALSYHMVAGGHEEVSRAVAANPPQIVLLAHEFTLDIDALQRATGHEYEPTKQVAGTMIFLRGGKSVPPPDGAPIFRDPSADSFVVRAWISSHNA